MPIITNRKLRFGPFELDTHAGELYKHDLKLKLQGHPIQILGMLLERPGELISREEIQQKLWPSESETFVDFEHGLNTAVRKLRQALGDEAETSHYIETLPRRGYRFVGQIATEENTAQAPAIDSTKTAATQAEGIAAAIEAKERLSHRPQLALIAVPILLGFAAWLLYPVWKHSEPLKIIGTKQLTFSGSVIYNGLSQQDNYGSIQTDGRRIYYTVYARALSDKPLHSVAVTGGDETLISTSFSPTLLNISPDGSTLLMRELHGENGSVEAPIWLVAASGGSVRRLGDVVAQDAAFAPDGKTIVFAKGSDLFLTNTQGLNPAKLATAAGRAFWLRWSPDGQRLRFSVLDTERIRLTMWELGSDRKLHQLLKDWKLGIGPCCGIWSSDGKYFLFLSNDQYWYIHEPLTSSSQAELLATGGLLVNAATANPLANEIFITSASPTSDVFQWDPATGHMQPLLPGLHARRVAFSPDRREIAYTTLNPAELWQVRVDGTDKRQIASGVGVYMVRFSPDGQKIAFMTRQPRQPWKIYWVSIGGGAWHEISALQVNQADPSWSPDSETILFGEPAQDFGDPGVPRRLYLYNIRSGKMDEVPGSTGLFSPRWSPDGRYIAAMTIDSKNLMLLDTSTNKWTLLAVHSDVHNPFWSPDSKWVYFNGTDADTLWRARIKDHHSEQLGPLPLPSNYTSCSADGFAPSGDVLIICADRRSNIFALQLK